MWPWWTAIRACRRCSSCGSILERRRALIGASPSIDGPCRPIRSFRDADRGVHDHSVADGDFRAEGTKNELGIRSCGNKGMRVYDFGWQQAVRG